MTRGSRRSDRIELAVQVEVSGMDTLGQMFVEKLTTQNVSRHGATLRLPQKLSPQQELTVRKAGGKSIEMAVVGVTAEAEGQFSYGVVFKDQRADFWGIDFPEIGDEEKATTRVLLDCCACTKRELAYLNEVELMVFHASGTIMRACKKCSTSTMWKRAEHDTWVEPAPLPAAVAPAKPAPEPEIDGRTIKRKHPRLKMRMEVCVRSADHGNDVVQLEDISRGGFGFRSRNRYHRDQQVEAATNYQKSGPNIFVPVRITSAGRPGADGAARYGAAYVSEKAASSGARAK